MKVLVSSAFQQDEEHVGVFPSVFPQNQKLDSIIAYDTSGQPIQFKVDVTGTSGYRNGVKVSIPEQFSIIKSSSQLRFVLEAHALIASQTGDVDFRVRSLANAGSRSGAGHQSGIGEAELGVMGVMSDCAGAGCAGVGCVTVGCAAAGKGGGGCAAAGCAAVGCAGAGCAAVGCAGAACAAAGKGGGGCGAAGCAAVGCGAAGCAAAACAAVGCLAAGCATVACGAATGACGAAACALDALCGANAGWPP